MRVLLSLSFVLFSALVQAAVIIPKAPSLEASSYILLDAASGKVLVEYNADKQLPPASLTKLMTSYIAIDEIIQGRAEDSTLVPVSIKAWKMGGSKMFIREGTQVPLHDLLQGVVVQSGNDASIAVAEYFASSEEDFAVMMNSYAERFGMTSTNFENATGWPAPKHLSTARDMATLAWHIINDHPDYYPLYAQKYYEYNDIRQPNRNRLLWRDPTVDGLKTGHTDEAGFCLVSSAKRDDTRFIAVVMGARSDEARTRETQKLLSYGFRYYESRRLYLAMEELKTQKVWMAKTDILSLGLAADLFLTIPKGSTGDLKVSLRTEDVIKAPIKKGQKLGELEVSHNGEVIAKRPLVALQAVAEAGFFGRLWDGIKLFFNQLFV